mgnify:CR=1 FL=1
MVLALPRIGARFIITEAKEVCVQLFVRLVQNG